MDCLDKYASTHVTNKLCLDGSLNELGHGKICKKGIRLRKTLISLRRRILIRTINGRLR